MGAMCSAETSSSEQLASRISAESLEWMHCYGWETVSKLGKVNIEQPPERSNRAALKQSSEQLEASLST